MLWYFLVCLSSFKLKARFLICMSWCHENCDKSWHCPYTKWCVSWHCLVICHDMVCTGHDKPGVSSTSEHKCQGVWCMKDWYPPYYWIYSIVAVQCQHQWEYCILSGLKEWTNCIVGPRIFLWPALYVLCYLSTYLR